MKQFLVQALIEEHALWDTMQFLESKLARQIMARPHFEATPGGTEAADAVVALNGGKRRTRRPPMAPTIRAAVAAMLAKQETVTIKDLAEASGMSRASIYRTLFELDKNGHLKWLSPGTYGKGKKELVL